jgi:hypothetical protein
MAGSTRKIALSAVIASLALTVPAYAEDSSVDGYGGPGGNVQDVLGQDQEGQGGSGQAPAGGGGETTPVDEVTASQGGNALPFTGLDIGVLLAGGLALLGLGLGMRRLARNPSGS